MFKMQLQIIQSNRGGKFALHDGHSYNQKQSTNNCIHCRCTKYYKLKCLSAILKTKNETVIETKGTHNHECDPAHVKAPFELVIEEITDVIEREQFEECLVKKMDELAIYFKSGASTTFPIEMWKQYDAAGEG